MFAFFLEKVPLLVKNNDDKQGYIQHFLWNEDRPPEGDANLGTFKLSETPIWSVPKVSLGSASDKNNHPDIVCCLLIPFLIHATQELIKILQLSIFFRLW